MHLSLAYLIGGILVLVLLWGQFSVKWRLLERKHSNVTRVNLITGTATEWLMGDLQKHHGNAGLKADSYSMWDRTAWCKSQSHSAQWNSTHHWKAVSCLALNISFEYFRTSVGCRSPKLEKEKPWVYGAWIAFFAYGYDKNTLEKAIQEKITYSGS